jgi:hypothetical protein
LGNKRGLSSRFEVPCWKQIVWRIVLCNFLSR